MANIEKSILPNEEALDNVLENTGALDEITLPTAEEDLVVDSIPDNSNTGVLDEIVVPESSDKELSSDNGTEKPRVVINRTPAKNVIQESEVFAPLDDPKDADGIALSLPSDTQANINTLLEGMPNIDIKETPNGSEWIERIKAAKYTRPFGEWFDDTVERADSMFKQSVQSEKGKLTAGGLKFNDGMGTKLTGERAVLRVRALTGLGSVVMVPLWHSGFWITLKAPTESAMLELNRRLSEEKIELGRATYGLAFSNNSVFFAGWLIDFALSHVYDTSLKADVSEDIRSRISQLDVPLLIWGLACAIWPNGFPYARAVMDQSTEQTKIIKEKVNVGRLLWVDNLSLTPWQISHMAQRHGNSMTAETLDRYKSEFTRGKGRVVKLNDSISITLRVPNIDQYITSGQKWVNNIVAMVDKAFNMSANDGVRDSYIMDQGKATNLRQFAHFVESLEVADGVIDDVDTLDQTFDALSSSNEIRTAFFKGIKEFIEDATIAVIAIPVTEDAEKSDLPRFPHLLPLDVMSVFFIQVTTTVYLIQARN